MANTNKTNIKHTCKKSCKSTGRSEELDDKVLIYCNSRPKDEIIILQKIADNLKSPLSTINYHCKALIKDGLMDEETYRPTEKGIKKILHLKYWDKMYSKKVRAHTIQVVLKLLRTPNDFNKIQNTIFAPFSNGRYRGLKGQIAGFTILIYNPHKAVATIPDIYANDDEEIAAAIIDCCTQIKQGLELEFPGLVVEGYKLARYTSMHIAVLDSIIAEKYMLSTNTCYAKDNIKIDKSHGRYELETEDKRDALNDIPFLIKYEEIARKENELTDFFFKILMRPRGEQNESETA